MIGDLAQNGGNFATAQANNQAYLQNAQFGLQQQAQYANQAMAQQRFQQDQENRQSQERMQQQQLDRGDYWNNRRYTEQAAHDERTGQARSDQIDQQYGLKGQQQQNNLDFRSSQGDLNRQSREDINSATNDTRRYGIDERTGFNYDRLDQLGDFGQQRLDQGQQRIGQGQQRVDQGQQRIDQLKANLAARIAGGNPRDRQNYLNQQGDFIANNPAMRFEMHARETEIKSIMSERDQLTKQVPKSFGQGQTALLSRLKAVNEMLATKTGELLNRFAAAKPDASKPAANRPGFNSNYNGPLYGGFDQDGSPTDPYGGLPPDPRYDQGGDDAGFQSAPAPVNYFTPTNDQGQLEAQYGPYAPPTTRPTATPFETQRAAPQPPPGPPLPPGAMNLIQAMKARGANRQAIKDELQRQFGISDTQ